MSEKVQSWILWYHSESHKKDRYFVGLTQVPCEKHGHHLYPAWSYEKDGATIMDGDLGQKTKAMCEAFGYKNLKLEPIDESKNPGMQKPEVVKSPQTPVGSVH